MLHSIFEHRETPEAVQMLVNQTGWTKGEYSYDNTIRYVIFQINKLQVDPKIWVDLGVVGLSEKGRMQRIVTEYPFY